MTTLYQSIFPPEGKRALAVFAHGLGPGKAPTHYFFDNNADLLAAAQGFDQRGMNVYHGCAVYQTDANRKGENVKAVKTFWVDLDVGAAKPYATQKAAATHYEEFRLALGLPLTHIVSSGGGVHIYHAFTAALPPDQWDPLADLFRACLDHYGVLHDSSRTGDKASILRIPGTHNHKTNPARPVTLKRLGTEVPASEIFSILTAYATAHGIIVARKPPTPTKAKATNKLIGNGPEYPPSIGDRIAQRCPIIKEVADTGGDVPYEIWWRAMGVAKHCQDAQAAAAHWTRNRQATGHDKFDFQGVMDAWAYGPTTCEDFSRHSDKCHACDPLGAKA